MVKLAAEIVCLWKASSVFPSGKKYQGAGMWMGRKCLLWWEDVHFISSSWICDVPDSPKCGFTTRLSLLVALCPAQPCVRPRAWRAPSPAGAGFGLEIRAFGVCSPGQAGACCSDLSHAERALWWLEGVFFFPLGW